MSFLGKYSDLFLAIVRVTLGLFYLAHGIPKLLAILAFIGNVPAPFPINWVLGIFTLIVEVAGGVMLVIGFRARVAAFLGAILFFGIAIVVHAIQTDHFLQLFNATANDKQSAFEYPFLLAVTSLLVASLGPGSYHTRRG